MSGSPHDGVRVEVTLCLFCNLFRRCHTQTKDLKPPEIGRPSRFVTFLPALASPWATKGRDRQKSLCVDNHVRLKRLGNLQMSPSLQGVSRSDQAFILRTKQHSQGARGTPTEVPRLLHRRLFRRTEPAASDSDCVGWRLNEGRIAPWESH